MPRQRTKAVILESDGVTIAHTFHAAFPESLGLAEANRSAVFDSTHLSGDLTDAEFQLAKSGERPTWNGSNDVGSRVVENPYHRLRFSPLNILVVEGTMPHPTVTIQLEHRDGRVIRANQDVYIVKRVNKSYNEISRVAFTNGQAVVSIDTSEPRTFTVGNQPEPDGSGTRAVTIARDHILRVVIAKNNF